MAKIAGISAEVIYASQGNIGFPGTSGEKTLAEARAVAELNAQLGSGVTVSAASIPAAR